MSSDRPGYYDPHPLVSIDRPLALVGHPGSGVAGVARMICGRTGLPFNDVARSAEALAGCSRSQLVLERGAAALLEIEMQALRSAILRKPYGVIAFESRLLEAPESRAWIHERCSVVYVRRPDEVLLDRIRRQLAERPGSLPEFMTAHPATPKELRAFLAPFEAAVANSAVLLDAGAEHGSRIAEKIVASLDRLLDVERLDR